MRYHLDYVHNPYIWAGDWTGSIVVYQFHAGRWECHYRFATLTPPVIPL